MNRKLGIRTITLAECKKRGGKNPQLRRREPKTVTFEEFVVRG